ncbi:MAG: DUF4423 domain-containing protein [Bdellovibrionales bacterium]|nr:DUF4423 domain-containing protein [Oligoflexia bacterium]
MTKELVHHDRDYRVTLRQKIADIQQKQPSFTLKKLAAKIPIQYTYLSKAMNHPKVHLGEDDLFTLCEQLKFLPEERDFILMKRALATTANSDRKKYLQQKIEAVLKKQTLNAETQGYSSQTQAQEVQYLFDPLCVIVQVSLGIESVRKNPALLCEKLGIGFSELKLTLQKLVRNEIIELEEGSSIKIKRVLRNSLHYGPDHPFMRVHQSLLKTAIASQLLRCPEEAKQSFVATFTMDESSFDRIQQEFRSFLKNVETIARKSRAVQVYQMNFDLFRWF